MVYLKKRGKPNGGGISYLQYIESTGSQYIDTDFIPDGNTRVYITFKATNATGSWEAVFGVRNASDSKASKMFNLYRISEQTFRTDYFGENYSYTNVDISQTIVCDKNKNITIINGAQNKLTKKSTQCDDTLLLFAMNDAGKISSYVKMRLYSCQIYDNGQLVRDYAPALDEAGASCLYDKVSKSYVYNAGSGAFIAG